MKPLLIIGLVAALGAAGLQFMIRSSLIQARKDKDAANRQVVQIHNETRQTIEAINQAAQTYAETDKNARNEELQTKTLLSEVTAKEKELVSVQKEIEEINAKKAQITDEINRILGTGTQEEMLARVEQIKRENDEKVALLEELDKELAAARKASSENEVVIARLRQEQSARDRQISLSSRTGSVVAVNPEWSFVVVNMGQNQGVSNSSRLLVKRGNQMIGRLIVVQVEANRTIADIDPRSLASGFQVQPGDEVVFDNSAS